MDDTNNITDLNGFDENLEVIDLLIADASAAIDAGEFSAALEGFREALRLARGLFGDNREMAELDKTITDINEILETP